MPGCSCTHHRAPNSAATSPSSSAAAASTSRVKVLILLQVVMADPSAKVLALDTGPPLAGQGGNFAYRQGSVEIAWKNMTIEGGGVGKRAQLTDTILTKEKVRIHGGNFDFEVAIFDQNF